MAFSLTILSVIISFHLSPFGEELTNYKISVPRLKVRRDWFSGLDPDHVDHEHPDIHADIVDHGERGERERGSAGEGGSEGGRGSRWETGSANVGLCINVCVST